MTSTCLLCNAPIDPSDVAEHIADEHPWDGEPLDAVVPDPPTPWPWECGYGPSGVRFENGTGL